MHGLCRLVVAFGILYLVAKLAEVWWAGEAMLLAWSSAIFWWAELGIGLAAPGRDSGPFRRARTSTVQWLVPILVLAGVLMNRFDATLPDRSSPLRRHTPRNPSEWVSTVGILAVALMAWMIGVRFFSGSTELAENGEKNH